ncbi:hypothetical protein E5554_11510 [Sphingobium sp. PAMC28499]|jgi:hypothetical protein|uniref:hypothetical protein n=1 Tax=unclassified Sphingobium TaxID=2611147 RepID=UPI000C06C9C5|nr:MULTISPECIES: hypothetical protein [unclassified Sphingobium]PHP17459.1 hypothetical protein CG471_22615 [Sphingobium sp. IP1]QCB38408.1 hypothetical protein E5554_11510 [Sphingobium sp. PAMC28499]
MNDLSCTMDMLAGLKDLRDRTARKHPEVNEALQEAIDDTCSKIEAAFAQQSKVRARLRA